ncbi:MAG: hypothetical protein KAS57_05440 [Gammaproteobacteria bacterium]|nr:hypothetical protein [Gammaproteobacteria bacterium]
MKILFQTLLLIFILNSSSVFASHSFAGMDMCAVYPEVMPPGLEPALLPDAGGQGSLMMEEYCTQCHAMPGPGRHTAEEWPQVLERMLVLMDVADRFGGLLGNVKTPSSGEREQLRDYLNLYALKPVTTKPQGVGANAFENYCGDCHALPDMSQYNHFDQSSLIKRMQRNMEVMKYSPPSSDSMMQIQLYLQENTGAVAVSNAAVDEWLTVKKNIDVDGSYNKSFSFGSWLALAPFFVLVFIGLLRWWSNHQKTRV